MYGRYGMCLLFIFRAILTNTAYVHWIRCSPRGSHLVLYFPIRRWPNIKPTLVQRLVSVWLGSVVWSSHRVKWLQVFARYLSVTEAPHNTDFHTWMGKKHFCFFETAESHINTEPYSTTFSDHVVCYRPYLCYRQTPWAHANILCIHYPLLPGQSDQHQTTQSKWPECDLPHCSQ